MNALTTSVLTALLFQAGAAEPRGSIAGRVISAHMGEGLRAAHVTLSAEIQNQRITRSSITAADGSFTFDRLPAGAYSLVIQKYGYRPATDLPARILLEHNQTRAGLDFKMHRPGVLAGTVTDAERLPIAGAQVTAFRTVWAYGRRRAVSAGKARTDDRGRYRIFGLEPGRYLIGATAATERAPEGELDVTLRAYYPAAHRLSEAVPVSVAWGKEAADISLVLRAQPGFAVTGRVADQAAGAPCHSCLISVRLVEEVVESDALSFRVAADGSYRVRGLTPGLHRVTVEKTTPPYTGASRVIQVSNRNLRDVDLEVGLEATLAGRVILDSPPPDLDRGKMELTVVVRGESAGEEEARVAPDLSFEVQGLSPQPYRVFLDRLPTGAYLKVLRLAGQDLPGPVIELPGGGSRSQIEVVVAFDSATLSGKVKSDRPEQAANAAILVFPQGNQSPYLLERRIQADRTGGFLLSGMAPGRYTVFAAPPTVAYELADPEARRHLQNLGRSLVLSRGEKTFIELALVPSPEEP